MSRHPAPYFSASMKRPAPRPTRALIEELEPRLLYSADFAPTLADALILGAEERVIGGDGEYATTTDSQRDAQHARFEVVFIDLRVEGYQQILADIREQNSDGRSIEVILLDSDRDGIEQIGNYLNTRQEIDAIHIISHGGAGSIQLGSGQLNFDSMIKHAAAIKQWGSALNSDADILIYGCDLASTADGQSLIDALSRLTGADVAASDDLTGSALLGGNWILEYQTGQIETRVALDAKGQSQWKGVLVNTAPTLDASQSPTLTTQNMNGGIPVGAVGSLVSSLVDFATPSGQVDNVDDPDASALLGIAVTAANSSNGSWWYSTDNGSSWSSLGTVSDTSALLLAADANTRLYFQADANYNGTLASAITFRAWDQTSDTNGSQANTSTNGGTTTFSTATDTASLVVNAVNNEPTAIDDTASTSEDNVLTVNASGVLANDLNANLTAGATLNFNAASDGDAVWNNETAVAGYDWTLANFGTQSTYTSTPTTAYSGITGAYQFSGTDSGASMSNLEGIAGDPTNNSASFEIWFRPNVLTATSGQHIVFEVGGATHGTTLYLDNTLLKFATRTSGATPNEASVDLSSLYADPTAEFIQVVGVIDQANSELRLYVDGTLRATASLTGSNGSDWSGPDLSGLGAAYTDIATGPAAGSGLLDGDVAIFRFYEKALVTAETAANFNAVAGSSLSVSKIQGNAANVGNQITLASGALLTMNADGSYVYNPNGKFEYLVAGQTATDRFDYTIINTASASDIGVVTLTVNGVNDAPTATNLSAAETYTEDTPLDLTDIVVSDVDNADVTVTLTLSNTGAGSLNTGTSGAVTSTFVSGVWTASGTIADVNALLAALTFTPAANFNASFSIATRVDDGSLSVTGSKAFTGIAVNDAPTLGNGTLASVAEDTLNPAGQTVNTLFTGQFNDVDAGSSFGGVAVVGNTAIAGTQGTWQYSTDGGSNWFAIGSVTDGTTALALSSSTLIRFVPVANYNGSPPALVVRGLDNTYIAGYSSTTAGSESRVNVDTASAGGSTAIAAATATLSTTITAVNDAPTLVGWYDNNWTYRNEISIDHTQVAGNVDLTDFTVLINLSAHADLAAGALSSGSDIRFTSADGTTLLAHEIETFTSANGALMAWVKLPTLSAHVDTRIYMYYGNAAATAQATSSGVWDASTAAVYHLGESTNPYLDSTGNANTSISGTIPTAASGWVGGGQHFDGSTTTIVIADSPTLNQSQNVTVSAWVKLDAYGNVDLVEKGGFGGYTLWLKNDVMWFGTQNAVVNAWAVSTTPLSLGVWYALDGVNNNGINSLYINGVLNASSSIASSFTNTGTLQLGNGYDGYLNGILDEVRVDTTARTAGWISTKYNNTASPATFSVVGAQQVGTGATTRLAATDEDTPSAATSVNTILTNVFWADADMGAVKGIAVTAMTGNGAWQYSSNGISWTGFGAVNSINALLLDSATDIRYIPDAANGETATFGFRAWDKTSGSASSSALPSYANPGTGGGTSAYSAQTATAAMTVTDINDAPTATNLNAAETYTEDTPLDLIDIMVSDVDSANVTVTLTLSNTGAGSLSTGTSGTVTSTFTGGIWTASGAIADVNALLAAITFTPTADFNASFALATRVSDGSLSITGSKAFTGMPVDDPALISGDTRYSGYSSDAVGGTLSATDVEGLTDGTYFSITSAASYGTAAIDAATGAWTFTATDANWFGPDSFTVTVTDDQGGNTTQVISIMLNPVNFLDAAASPVLIATNPVDPSNSAVPASQPDAEPGDPADAETETAVVDTKDQLMGESALTAASTLSGVENTTQNIPLKVSELRFYNELSRIHQEFSNAETRDGILMRLLELIRAEGTSSSSGQNTISPAIRVDISQEEGFQVEVLRQGAQITAISMSVGAVWWALRVGGFFASLLTSLPAWRSFDMLPVLSRDNDEDENESDWALNPEEDKHAVKDSKRLLEETS